MELWNEGDMGNFEITSMHVEDKGKDKGKGYWMLRYQAQLGLVI